MGSNPPRTAKAVIMQALVIPMFLAAACQNLPPSAPPAHGQTHAATLDPALQKIAGEELARMAKQFHTKSAFAIMVSPHNGAILALAHFPADATETPPGFRTAEAAFEPGPLLKPILVAGCLEQGIQLPADVMTMAASRHPLQDAVQQLDNARLEEVLEKFGFGQPTGAFGAAEPSGLLPPVAKWSPSMSRRLAHGQGLAATPLQLVRAWSALANGGELPVLHAAGGGAPPPSVIVSRQTVRETISRLEGLPEAAKAAVPGHAVVGKAGTTQKVVGGAYSNTAHLATFIGFAPADNPRFVLLVMADEPNFHTGYNGMTVAAPAFSRIAQRSLQYLEASETPDGRQAGHDANQPVLP